jgi:hypothetical protein
VDFCPGGPMPTFASSVIPGRRIAANPESMHTGSCSSIPGSALRAAPE